MVPKFSERCAFLEVTLKDRLPVPLNLAFTFANPIMNLVDILMYSSFPDDEQFYEKLFSFSDHVYLSDLRPPLRTLWHICKMKGNNCIAYQKMIIHSFVTMLS